MLAFYGNETRKLQIGPVRWLDRCNTLVRWLGVQ